jgi:hypothetical protein
VWSDPYNYPPTDSVINGIPFTTYTIVERMKKKADETLEMKAWSSGDTGLKQISLAIVWKERGEWRKIQLTNLLENPDRKQADGDFVGRVTDTATTLPLQDVMVDIAENSSLNAVTEASGDYRLGAQQGTYTLRVSKKGYFTKTIEKAIQAGELSSTVGPAYDSGNNSLDWAVNNGAPHSPPRASASPALPVRTGIPSNGALIFADDGLSQMTQAALTGSPPEARFTLSSVATGTWTVSASSGNFFLSFSTPIGAGVNLSTSVVMNTSTLYGFASGRVVDALGLGGLAGISISPGVGLTNGLGFFNVPLFPGAQTLTANKGSTNPNYTETSLPITIVRGQSSSNHTLYLSGGARIQGLLTIDGVTPLPNVPVEVTNVGTGMTMDNAISNPSGLFSVSVPVGTYAVRPTVEFGESISPDTPAVNANVGGSTVFAATYTVTSAYGTLTGKVTHQGKPITTGVLLMPASWRFRLLLPQ